MNFPRSLAVVIGALAAAPAVLAASSAVTSASDSASTSVDATSRSLHRSSTSSSPRPLAQGDYRVVQVARLADGSNEVSLQAVEGGGGEGSFTLRLADKAVADGGLVVGQVVTARQRPYGYEFLRADTRTAFFLMLDDDWHRELPSVPVRS